MFKFAIPCCNDFKFNLMLSNRDLFNVINAFLQSAYFHNPSQVFFKGFLKVNITCCYIFTLQEQLLPKNTFQLLLFFLERCS